MIETAKIIGYYGFTALGVASFIRWMVSKCLGGSKRVNDVTALTNKPLNGREMNVAYSCEQFDNRVQSLKKILENINPDQFAIDDNEKNFIKNHVLTFNNVVKELNLLSDMYFSVAQQKIADKDFDECKKKFKNSLADMHKKITLHLNKVKRFTTSGMVEAKKMFHREHEYLDRLKKEMDQCLSDDNEKKFYIYECNEICKHIQVWIATHGLA